MNESAATKFCFCTWDYHIVKRFAGVLNNLAKKIRGEQIWLLKTTKHKKKEAAVASRTLSDTFKERDGISRLLLLFCPCWCHLLNQSSSDLRRLLPASLPQPEVVLSAGSLHTALSSFFF